MRKPINVLYYPNSTIDPTTLKRAILLFDEFHITDNPSFSFGGGGKSNFGMVGSDSPLRQVERSFRDEGVPLYVHSAPGEEFQRRTTRRFAQMSTIWSFYGASNRDSTIHLPSAVQSFRRETTGPSGIKMT